MNLKHTLLLALVLSPLAGSAAELTNVGILGNSGEQGSTLVRFGVPANFGTGVVYDRFGTLWSRGGSGVLNRYALDGRQLATFPLPVSPAPGNDDSIALIGEDLMLLIDHHFYTLSITAPAGTAPTPLSLDANRMSQSAHEGWVAAVSELDVFLINAKGEKRPAGKLDKKEYYGIELGPDLSVYLQIGGNKTCHFSPDGTLKIFAPGLPGGRSMLLDGAWYGFMWHGTIRRSDVKFRPAPGVIIGGNSGSFLGHVDECTELFHGSGLAQVSPHLFAASGFRCILFLLDWQAANKRMQLVRRIGAIPECTALGLDREGYVWFNGAAWNWTDGPATPQRSGVPYPDAVFAATMLPDDTLLAYSRLWGGPKLWTGKLTVETSGRELNKAVMPMEGVVAIAATKIKDRLAVLTLSQTGKALAVYIEPNGAPKEFAGEVALNTASPVKEWKSLTAIGDNSLMAAADGFLIEFERDGDHWKESKRWNSWGAAEGEKFGGEIYLCVDEGKLWISDTQRHRVVCLDAASHGLVAMFGSLDRAGDDLKSLNQPKTLMGRGQRAVVFDSVNQRLVKLELSSH